MEKEEALAKIKSLLHKLDITKNKKLKEIYLTDILVLEEFLDINYNIKLIENTKVLDDIMDDINKLAFDDFINTTGGFIKLNDKTRRLANGVINIYDKANYVNYYSLDHPTYDTNFLYSTLIEFLGVVDEKVLNKFYKYQDQAYIISNKESDVDGLCFNLCSLDKQLITLFNNYYLCQESVSEVGFFSVFAHEIGHAIYNDLINKIGMNKNYSNPFTESISMLYEKMYIDYLKNNNIKVDNVLRNEYNLLLANSLLARAGTFAVNDDLLIDGYIIPDFYFSKSYFNKYNYVFDNIYTDDYSTPLLYFYGELIATKFMDDYGSDYKNASKDLIEYLIRNENEDSEDLLEEIGLTKVPKGLAKSLRSFK